MLIGRIFCLSLLCFFCFHPLLLRNPTLTLRRIATELILPTPAGEPLHKLRQFGINIRELDLLDETQLNVEQIREVCAIIFGGHVDDYPHPGLELERFIEVLTSLNKKEPKVWNPLTKKNAHWIDPRKIEAMSAPANKCVIM